jgi:hypothetical protein
LFLGENEVKSMGVPALLKPSVPVKTGRRFFCCAALSASYLLMISVAGASEGMSSSYEFVDDSFVINGKGLA